MPNKNEDNWNFVCGKMVWQKARPSLLLFVMYLYKFVILVRWSTMVTFAYSALLTRLIIKQLISFSANPFEITQKHENMTLISVEP